MRITNSPAFTFDWLDRGPLTITKGFTGVVLNDGAGTIRWTYTVPAGRRAFVSALSLYTRVSIAAGPNDFGRGTLDVNDGTTLAYLGVAEVNASAIGNADRSLAGTGIYLAAADVIRFTTVTVGSTTAVYQWYAGATILEFDA